jgi:cysteinyl-tRNA synthetase
VDRHKGLNARWLLFLLSWQCLILKRTIGFPQEILDLAEERKKAKLEKDWKKSDELRDKIKELGFEIKDGKDGYELIKI